MDIKKVFGSNVRFYRKCKGFSQEALSEKLDIGPNHLSKIERGAAFVSAELLEQIVSMLDVPAEALFSAEEEHKAGDAVIAHFGRIVEEELHRTEEMIKRRMRTDGGVSPPSLQPCTPAGYEASIKVAATPEDALERLHQSIITDIRQEITGMRQVVRETLQETLAGKCKK